MRDKSYPLKLLYNEHSKGYYSKNIPMKADLNTRSVYREGGGEIQLEILSETSRSNNDWNEPVAATRQMLRTSCKSGSSALIGFTSMDTTYY